MVFKKKKTIFNPKGDAPVVEVKKELSLLDLLDTFFSAKHSQEAIEILRKEWGKDFEANMDIAILTYINMKDKKATLNIDKKYPDIVERMKMFYVIGNAIKRTGIKVQ